MFSGKYPRYLWHKLWPNRRRVTLAVAMNLMVMLLELTPPMIFGLILGVVVKNENYEWLIPLIAAMILVPILIAGIRIVADYAVSIIGQRLLFDMRLDLYRHVQWLSNRYMQQNTSGRVMERLRGDVAQVQKIVNAQIMVMAREVVVGAIAITLICFMSWQLGLLIFVSIVLYLLSFRWFTRRIRKIQRRHRRKMDQLSTLALERLNAAEMVQSSMTQRQEARSFLKMNYKTEKLHHRFRLYNSNYTQTTLGILWTTYACMLALGSLLILGGHLDIEILVICAMYTQKLIRPMVMLSDMSNQIIQARVALDRMFEMMQAETDPAAQGGEPVGQLKGHLEFRDVNFGYLPGQHVLKNINFSLEPGQTLALVGRTGCGKSTTARLLYRFYDPTSGAILVDGQELSKLDARQYRQRVAMVPQDPIVFQASIRENIAYGYPRASTEEIEAAAHLAGLDDTLAHLSEGLNTRIGETGISLSLGERQRVCLARAILADPGILILDEATSSLDAIHEAEIQPALNKAMADRTCVVIAHRLSTIKHADLILLIDEGQILEQGNHDELMNIPDGRYRRMFLTQSGVIEQANRQVMEVNA